MASILELLKEGKKRDVWMKYCGFIDLSIDEFIKVQERLLTEQLGLLSNSGMAKIMFNQPIPDNLNDFRKYIPLTTYENYVSFLGQKNEDVLPAKPQYWICTSGKLGNYERKWAPYSRGMVQIHAKNFFSAIIFSLCSKKYDFTLKENYKFLYAMAPPPYMTGMVPYGLMDKFPFEYLPPLPVAEKMTFEERNTEGFRLGLVRGIDLFFGVSSVLVKIGEKFSRQEFGDSDFRRSNFLAKLRLAWGLAKAGIRGRKLLPKDVWSLKGIICAGTDTAFYKDRIEYYWGKKPIEIYGGTEIGIAATQTWDHEGLILFPDANFWEFIPEEEYCKSVADPGYIPSTVLTHEIEPGKRYELVITNFRGGAFIRYRLGDFIRVLSLRNHNLNINLPQIVYEDRARDVIDIANFTRITERTVWEALERANITHGRWVARKGFAKDHPIMELYIEIDSGSEFQSIEEKIHLALRSVDSDYHDLEDIIGFRPLKLVPLPEGCFKLVMQKNRGAGNGREMEAITRINPPDRIIAELAQYSLMREGD